MPGEEQKQIIEDIEWIKSELKNPGSVVHRLYSSKTPKKDLILLWAQKLEDLGNEPKTISTQIRNDLKSLGMESAIVYAREVLPFKYKDPDKIHSEEEETRDAQQPGDSSILLADDCKKANANYIQRIKKTVKLLQQFSKQLETSVILETEIPEDEMEEYLTRWDHAIDRGEQILDGRDKVLPSTQHILIYCLATSTLNYTYANYVKRVRELASLTAKQAGKILKGHVSKMQLLYEPKSQDEAVESGFYGIQCGECGSWRTAIKWISSRHDNLLHCFACGNDQEPKTLKLPKKGLP